MSAQNSDSQILRLYRGTTGGLLAIIIMLLIMLGFATATYLRIANMGEIDHTRNEKGIVLDRKVDKKGFWRDREIDELNRKLKENSLLIAETQATLRFLMRGFTIRIEPKEQAGPAAAPAPGEQGGRP